LWATVLALALINIGLAASIVAAMGTASFAPLWVGLVLLALGVLIGAGAVRLWQHYLVGMRGR
jgi:hypothetical protein